MTMTSELENLDAPGRVFNVNHAGWCDFTWSDDRDEKDMPRIVYLDDKLSETEILALPTPSGARTFLRTRSSSVRTRTSDPWSHRS